MPSLYVIVYMLLTINTSQHSGIQGTVTRLAGNRMPAPNRPTPAPVGVRATVCIYELTSDSQTVHAPAPDAGAAPNSAPTSKAAATPNSPAYFRAISTRLIRQLDTDDKGYFQVEVPPGTYSVFTKHGDLFYASRRDEKNHIAPVEVLPGKVTRVQCSVESDHKVVY